MNMDRNTCRVPMRSTLTDVDTSRMTRDHSAAADHVAAAVGHQCPNRT
jgi:hypothetical protein